MIHYSEAPMFIERTDQLEANYRRAISAEKRYIWFIWAVVLVFSGVMYFATSLPESFFITSFFAVVVAVLLTVLQYGDMEKIVNEADQISPSDLNDLIQVIQENPHDEAIMASIKLINSQNRRPYIAEEKKIYDHLERKSQNAKDAMEAFSRLANQHPA